MFVLYVVSFRKPEDIPLKFRKQVPFQQLFTEFLIISTFPKIMGQAFIVVFNSFLVFIVRFLNLFLENNV